MHRDGRLFGTHQKGIFVYDPDADELSDYVTDYQATQFAGPNDLIFDAEGGLYFTDPFGSSVVNSVGSVYYVSPEGEVSKILDNMAFPNGITLSPDGSDLYVSDFGRNAIWRVPLLAPGVIDQNFTHVMTHLSGGMGPDGMAVDELGNVYVAHYEGGQVAVLSAKGKKLGFIPVPAGGGIWTTNVTFGGEATRRCS